jgi:hypothetical protein
MIPEEGSASDFKRAALEALPAVPRYHERRWLDDPFSKWAIIFNGSFGAAQFGIVLIELAYGVTTWATWLRIPAGLIQFGCVWLVLSSLRRNESIRATVFEELRLYREKAVEIGVWFTVDSIEQRMANMIRRRSCNFITDWQVVRRNRRHVETRQCACCKQISYGLRTLEEGAFFTETVYTFLETCPLCGWDWA